jgi:hypothetical protein
MKGLVVLLSLVQKVIYMIRVFGSISGLDVVVDCPWVHVLCTNVDLSNDTDGELRLDLVFIYRELLTPSGIQLC